MNARFINRINLEPLVRFVCLPLIIIGNAVGAAVFISQGGWYSVVGFAQIFAMGIIWARAKSR